MVSPAEVFSSSDAPFGLVAMTDWEVLAEDCLLAGYDLGFVGGKLGVEFDLSVPVPQYVRAYVDLLLALKDSRHAW